MGVPLRGAAKPPQGLPGAPEFRAALGFFVMSAAPPRAMVFIDGANLYHALKSAGVSAARIDPYKVARKLVQSRRFVELRYYIAAIDRSAPERVYGAYERTRALLDAYPDACLRTGHIQHLRETDPCAKALMEYLHSLPTRLPDRVYRDLHEIASRHREVVVHREKGVDVFLACDLVDAARSNAYDVAYLVSGDADFCPAVALVRSLGRRILVASPDISRRLAHEADAAIRLPPAWFADCGDSGR